MSTLTVGTISEKVVGSGVTVDSLNIKDGTLALAKSLKGNTETATISSSKTLDFGTYNNFILTLGSGSNTLANPTTEEVGSSGILIFIQPSSGNAGTVSLGTDYETVDGGGLSLSVANSAYDVVPFIVKASNSILLGKPLKAFS